jgi:hypothetical protein
MNASHTHTPMRQRQRGMAAVMVVVLLIAGVLFILSQTLNIVGTRSSDNAQDLDSTAALMLAESGLQRAQAVVGGAAVGGLYADTNCTAITATGPFALGRGTFNYSSAVSDPPTCGASSASPCSTCTVSVTGTVGSAVRTLSTLYELATVNGTTGTGQTVTMVLKNTSDFPAIALFQLAWQRQASGGNADASICANGASGCGNRWNVESSSGNTSVGGMGVSVTIPALTYSKVVTQTLTRSRNYTEVGGLFPGLSGAPTLLNSYWKESGGAHTKTVANAGSTGQVNSGAVVGAAGACVAAPDTYGSGSDQTCNTWCVGGDTLVFGVSGRSAAVTDQITGITFNTNGTPSQNVPMTRIVHYPDTDGSIVNASGKIYAEVWKAYNPDYMSDGTGVGATSYPTLVLATAGANIANTNVASGTTTLHVTSITNSANVQICVGDILSGQAGIDNHTITGTPGGTCSNSTGAYTFSPAASANANSAIAIKSTTLRVQAASGTSFTAGATNNGSVSIASGPVAGNYTLSSAATVGTSTLISQGASGTTIGVPLGTALPSVGTRVAIYSTGTGTGAFAAGTTVTAVGANSFTVSSAPTTVVQGATVCGGICAFFDSPSLTSSTTEFTVTASGGTTQWGGGFMCLKGVNDPLVVPVTSTTSTARTWQETVQ